MLAANSTPFAALGFEQIHRDGAPMAVVTARARYDLYADGRLELAGEQALVLSDEYEGAPATTPLLRAGDLVPFRPRADVTVLADAFAPGGRMAPSWTVGIRIEGFQQVLRIFGPRRWLPVGEGPAAGWRLEEPQAVVGTALDPRFAAGGRVFGDDTGEVDPRNPIGVGTIDARVTPRGRAYPAPLIESLAEPVTSPFTRPVPRGFGPVPPFWQSRLRHAGTYGDDWLRNRHPRLPADFDYRFHQVAPTDLIQPGYLRGDEVVEIAGLVVGGGMLAFQLPGVRPYGRWQWIDDRQVTARLDLDGLHIDLREGPPWRVDLTWRNWVPICPRFFKIDLSLGSVAETAWLPGAGEDGPGIDHGMAVSSLPEPVA